MSEYDYEVRGIATTVPPQYVLRPVWELRLHEETTAPTQDLDRLSELNAPRDAAGEKAKVSP